MEKENRIDDIKAEFELREKRLKLVYKILYVAVALWAALFVSIQRQRKVLCRYIADFSLRLRRQS